MIMLGEQMKNINSEKKYRISILIYTFETGKLEDKKKKETTRLKMIIK